MTGKVTGSSQEFIRLTAEVQAQVLAADVSAQVLAADVSHVAAAVEAELDVRGLHPTHREEPVGISDQVSKSTTKTLQEVLGISDTLAITFDKALQSQAGVSDEVVKATTKALANGAGVSDSGMVLLQSYVELGYFAEDYVGESRTF